MWVHMQYLKGARDLRSAIILALFVVGHICIGAQIATSAVASSTNWHLGPHRSRLRIESVLVELPLSEADMVLARLGLYCPSSCLI